MNKTKENNVQGHLHQLCWQDDNPMQLSGSVLKTDIIAPKS
jgi:hypothetical protein